MGINVITPATPTVTTNGQVSTPASDGANANTSTTTETTSASAASTNDGATPASSESTTPTTTSNPSDTTAANNQQTTTSNDPANTQQAQPNQQKLNVNVDPKSLEQITSLTSTNRKLTKDIEALQAQVAKLTQPNTDIETKLKRLEQFEKSPLHQLLQLRNATMEDIAKDVFEQSLKVDDPRVAQALDEVTKLKTEREAEKEAAKQRETAQVQAQQAATHKQAISYVDSVIKLTKVGDKLRWENIAKDNDAATRAFKAAGDIVERDFGEKKDEQGNVTRAGRQPTKEEANAIIQDCLDLEESRALALELVKQRKNGGQQAANVQPSRVGIAVVAAQETPGREGSPPKPAPTIDANRGPVPHTGRVPRGPTTAREARRRALQMVGDE